MKKRLILVTAVLIGSLLMVGCMKIPSLDRLIPDGPAEKTGTPEPHEQTGTPPVETGRGDPDAGPRNAYESYLEAKTDFTDRIDQAYDSISEASIEASLTLFNFALIDLLMGPAYLVWEDEATAKQEMGDFYGALDMKLEQTADKSVLTFTADGETLSFTGERLQGADGYGITVVFGDSQEQIRSEFVRTPYGFAGQYYVQEDSGTLHYMVAIEGLDGTIGIERDSVPPGSLTGKEAPDFPKAATEWYSFQGNRMTGMTARGEAIDAILP